MTVFGVVDLLHVHATYKRIHFSMSGIMAYTAKIACSLSNHAENLEFSTLLMSYQQIRRLAQSQQIGKTFVTYGPTGTCRNKTFSLHFLQSFYFTSNYHDLIPFIVWCNSGGSEEVILVAIVFVTHELIKETLRTVLSGVVAGRQEGNLKKLVVGKLSATMQNLGLKIFYLKKHLWAKI